MTQIYSKYLQSKKKQIIMEERGDVMELYLCIDLGGTSVKYAYMNQDGNKEEGGSFLLPKTLEEMYQEIKKLVDRRLRIKGIAISAPGAVNSETGIIAGASAIPYIHGPNIKKDLESLTGVTVELENDANCAALAEVWKGAGKDTQDSCFIVSGTGIGGAVVKNKKIHKGKHLHGGEFGIMLMDDLEEPGVLKIWSHVGSTVSVVRYVSKRLNIPMEELDGKDIFDNVNDNPIYQEAIERYYFNLARGIFNIQYSYDPEMIIIGGAISAREDLIEQVNKQLDLLLNSISEATIRPLVSKCQFANDANLVGALYHYLTVNS